MCQYDPPAHSEHFLDYGIIFKDLASLHPVHDSAKGLAQLL